MEVMNLRGWSYAENYTRLPATTYFDLCTYVRFPKKYGFMLFVQQKLLVLATERLVVLLNMENGGYASLGKNYGEKRTQDLWCRRSATLRKKLS